MSSEGAAQLAPGAIEVDESGGQVLVRFALPQEWFTLSELRQFGAYLVTVADENEPSPEVDELAQLLEVASLRTPGHRPTARALHQAGYRRERQDAPTPG